MKLSKYWWLVDAGGLLEGGVKLRVVYPVSVNNAHLNI